MSRAADDGWHGVLPLDKPVGPTSHDMVARVRRGLGTRRVGHTGTLDPFASGLLLLCLGPATRLAEYLTALPKRYAAVMRLGSGTDTDDATGQEIRASEAWRELSEPAIRAAFETQVGEILQVPPQYSAKKVAGERMYAAARRGEAIEAEPVRVTIMAIRVLRLDLPDVEFEVDCSSGTYIRAIARDVGEALGVGGHLSELRRTRVGRFDVGEALPSDLLDDHQAARERLVSPAAAVAHLPSRRLDERELTAIGHGQAVAAGGGLPMGGSVALLDPAGELAAIAERQGDVLRPRKVFA